jgi:hypothetical protein
MLPCSRLASGRVVPSGRVSTASIGVTPIQCRWKIFVLSFAGLAGSSIESA